MNYDFKLLFLGAPFVHNIPDIKGVVGKPVRVICPASGYPLDKITWYKGKYLYVLCIMILSET